VNDVVAAPALYLVATPIGNLGDITLRALETLRSVDVIASEDMRRTSILLRHFGIKKPQVSFREQKEERAGTRILTLIRAGQAVALVTDAGTPAIADPGFTLVRGAIVEGIDIVALPGPCALIHALVVSGLPVHSFTFRGFPPNRSSARRTFLAVDVESPHTLIFYESPHRLERMLVDALDVFGDRQAAVANDVTKKFEEVWRGTLSELLTRARSSRIRGEYVIVIAGAASRKARSRET
jgi:16S rRNA (cytidine1402-2'-O)-methyltransferase